MSVDAFIGAVKVKRDEAIEQFKALATGMQDGSVTDHTFVTAHIETVDKLVGAVLDVVAERYEDIVEGSATDSEGEECTVSLTCSSELSTLYFEEVSS